MRKRETSSLSLHPLYTYNPKVGDRFYVYHCTVEVRSREFNGVYMCAVIEDHGDVSWFPGELIELLRGTFVEKL